MIRFSLNIKSLREYKNMTQGDLADALNLKRTAISNYERDDSTPNLDTLLEIAKYFDIKIDDLLYKDLKKSLENGEIIQKDDEPPSNVMFLEHISAVAGYSIETFNQEEVSFFSIPYLPRRSGPYLAIRIQGDSMEPRFYSGDIVICYKIERLEDFKTNNYYIVSYQGEVRFKFVYASPADRCLLVLKSVNTMYVEEQVPIGEVELFRVVASLKVL